MKFPTKIYAAYAIFFFACVLVGCSASRPETKPSDTNAHYDPRNDPANFPKLKNSAE